jgi:superfamily I DNA/RNA helicase
MTMHASKGLEWPVVAVMAERGTDEAKGAESQDAILEARVVYVATARATQRLLVL